MVIVKCSSFLCAFHVKLAACFTLVVNKDMFEQGSRSNKKKGRDF